MADRVTAGLFIKSAALKGWPTSAERATDSAHMPVPLAGVSIDADICSFYARVVVAHRYVNKETTPIEAVYVFPLDEGAAVCAFEAIVDGTLVVGEVHERDKAFEMYDDAIGRRGTGRSCWTKNARTCSRRASATFHPAKKSSSNSPT